MKLSICRGLWFTRYIYVFRQTQHLFTFYSFLSVFFMSACLLYSYYSIAFQYIVFTDYWFKCLSFRTPPLLC
jgi:hypothetical protein